MAALSKLASCLGQRSRIRPGLAVAIAAACVFPLLVPADEPPAFRHVYVPFEDLDVLFGAKKGVLLDRLEFLELWKKAYPDGKPRPAAPNDLYLIGGNYAGEIAGDAFKIVGALEIVKNRPGWQLLPLEFAGVAIAAARLNDVPAVLTLSEKGVPQLLVREPGKQTLQLELTAPLSPGAEARRTQFRVPKAPGELTLTLTSDQQVRLEGSELPLASEAGKHRIPIFEQSDIALSVGPRTAAGERKPIVVGRTATKISIAPGQLSWRESIRVDVAAKPVAAIAVDFPAEMQVVEVTAPDLAKWDVRPSGVRSRLTLRFAAPWTGRRELQVHALGATPLERPWQLPHGEIVGAAEQSGVCELSHDVNLAVELRELRGARQLSVPGTTGYAKAFEAWRSDYAIGVSTWVKQRKLAATAASIINVGRSRVELNASVTIEPRNGALFDVALTLPKEWDVGSIESGGKALPYQTTIVGEKARLDILLPTPVAANAQTTLLVRADRAPDGWLKETEKTGTLDLTAIAVLGAAEIEGVLLVRAPPEIRVAVADAVGLESVPVAGIPNADAAVRLALRYRTDASKGTLEAQLRAPLLAAEIDAAALVTATHLAADYFLAYSIKQGVTDQLSFELPRNVATNEVDVRVLSAVQLESQSVDEVAPDRKRWTLKFGRDVDPTVIVQVHIDVARPAGSAAPTTLPLLTVDKATRQTGTVAIEGALDQQVSIEAKDLRPIDPSELPALPARPMQGRLVSAFQFRKPPYQLLVRAAKHPELPVLAAVCSQARLASVLDASGTLRQQAVFTIANVGLQNLAIALPPQSSMLSATLDGRPVELRRDGERYLVSLPIAQASTATTDVAVHYLTEASGLAAGGHFQQKPPTLNMPVVRVDWTLYLPENQAVVESHGAIAPVEPLQRDSLIGSIRRSLLRRGGGRVFNPLELLWFSMQSSATFDRVGSALPASKSPAPSLDESWLDGAAGRSGGGVVAPSKLSASRREAGAQAGFDRRAPAAPKSAAVERVQVGGEIRKSAEAPAIRRSQNRPADQPKSGDDNDGERLTVRDEAKKLAEAERVEPGQPAVSGEGKLKGTRLGERSTGGKGEGARGLLSLQLTLEAVGRPMQFIGAAGDGELLLRLVDERFANAMTAGVAIVIVLLGWLARNWSRPARAFWIAVLLATSLGLSGLAPLGWLFALDGLFLGAFGVWLTYILRAIGRMAFSTTTRFASSAALLLLAGVAMAEEKPTRSAMPSAPSTEPLPTIYVPYDSRHDPLRSQQVYLPRDEYQSLWNLANPSKVVLPDPTTTAALSEVDFVGSLAGTTARFEAAMTAWSFRDDWVALKLPIAEAVIKSVSIDGQPAALAANERAVAIAAAAAPAAPRFPTIFVRGRGSHKIVVQFEVPARLAGLTGSVNLQLAPVGAARLRFTLPERGLEVLPLGIRNGWTLVGNDVIAAVSHGGAIALRWQPTVNRGGDGAIVNLQQRSRVEVGAAGLRLMTELEYTVRQGVAARFELSIPESLMVRQVSGDALADWFLQGTDSQRRLVLRLNRAAEGAQRFVIDALAPAATKPVGGPAQGDAEIVVPQLVGAGVHRETGDLVIVGDPLLDVAVRQANGYQRIGKEAAVAPAPTEHGRSWPVLAAYRFTARPASIALLATARPARLSADFRSFFTIERERIRLTAVAALSQTGRPLVTARLRLPAEFNLDQVAVPGGVRWSVVDDAAGAFLDIEQTDLPDAEDATPMLVTVQGWLNRDPSTPTAKMSSMAAPAAFRQRGEWSVYLLPGLDAETTALVGLRPLEPSALSQSIGANVALPRRRIPPRLAFRQETQPAQLELALRKLSPRVDVDVTTVVGVRETSVAVVSRLRFGIERAGVRKLRFLAPDWLGADIDVAGLGVRQVESFPAGDGVRRFEIGLDREFVGKYELRVVKLFGLPEDGVIRAPRLAPLDVESTRSFVLLENQSSDQLDRIELGAGIESIEPDALPLAIAPPLRRRAVETLRLGSNAAEPRWRLRAAKPIDGIAASVNLFETTMVVAKDGQYRAQANLRVNNRLEQFLPLEFPAGANLWSVFVSGQPSKPAKGTRENVAVVLLPLPKTASGDMASTIEIVYTGAIAIEAGALKRWRFPAPRVVGDLPVAKTQLSLYLPRDFDYGMFEGMEEVETGIIELNRQEAELNDAFNLLTDYKKGKGAARQRAFSNLANFAISARNDNPVQSDRGREFQNRIADQNRRLVQEVQTIKQQEASKPAAGDRLQWTDFFENFESQAADEETGTTENKAYEELAARQERGLARDLDRIDGNRAPMQQQAQDHSQSRARLKGQLESQTAVLNRLQNEGRLNVDPNANKNAPAPSDSFNMREDVKDQLGKDSAGMTLPKQGNLQREGLGELLAKNRELGLVQQRSEPAPKRVGGLSLKIQLPTEGRELHFVAARGAALLSVAVYPAELAQTGAALGWLAAICVLAGGLAYGTSRPDSMPFLAHGWRWLAAALGLIWWLTLPGSVVGFFVFAFGLAALLWQRLVVRFSS